MYYYYDPLQSSREHGCVEFRTLHLKECTELKLHRGSYSEVNEPAVVNPAAEPKEPPTKKQKVLAILCSYCWMDIIMICTILL